MMKMMKCSRCGGGMVIGESIAAGICWICREVAKRNLAEAQTSTPAQESSPLIAEREGEMFDELYGAVKVWWEWLGGRNRTPSDHEWTLAETFMALEESKLNRVSCHAQREDQPDGCQFRGEGDQAALRGKLAKALVDLVLTGDISRTAVGHRAEEVADLILSLREATSQPEVGSVPCKRVWEGRMDDAGNFTDKDGDDLASFWVFEFNNKPVRVTIEEMSDATTEGGGKDK